MTKKDFIIQYTLNRARGYSADQTVRSYPNVGIGITNEALSAWDNITENGEFDKSLEDGQEGWEEIDPEE